MMIHKYKLIVMLIISGCFIMGSNLKAHGGPVVQSLSSVNRKIIRETLVNQLIKKYQDNQVFLKIHEYMVNKSEELHKGLPLNPPDNLIQDTFDKTGDLFERTKPFVGNRLVSSYEPEQFEKNIQRYLWLKGIGFFVMGIGYEHKLAISYFYLPGNESIKMDLMKDIVQYSFPEVPAVEENKFWYEEMVAIMGRLGYNIFSIRNYGI